MQNEQTHWDNRRTFLLIYFTFKLANTSTAMAIDWLGFGYAAAIVLGGFMGYKKKSSVTSLIAGLLFGSIAAYGAFMISNDPTKTFYSLVASGALTIVMGMRFKKSGKIIPGGIMAGLSVLMVLRLLFMSVIVM